MVIKKIFNWLINNQYGLGVGFFFGVLSTVIILHIYNPNINKPKIEEKSVDSLTIDTMKIKATYYNPTKLNITANGTKLNKSHDKKVVALSRDMFQNFSMGDSLYIISPSRLAGAYYICDKMNKRFKKRIDIFTTSKIDIDSVVILL